MIFTVKIWLDGKYLEKPLEAKNYLKARSLAETMCQKEAKGCSKSFSFQIVRKDGYMWKRSSFYDLKNGKWVVRETDVYAESGRPSA